MMAQSSDGSEECVLLKIFKEINPVEVAQFACTQGVEKESVFDFWVP